MWTANEAKYDSAFVKMLDYSLFQIDSIKNFCLLCLKVLTWIVKMPLMFWSKTGQTYEQLGERMANKVFELISTKKIHGIYIIGSGPNIATAFQSALIMCESTKLCFNGMAMAQYDHGPKETAANSIVIQIIAKGKSFERSQKLSEIIRNSGAHVITVEETEVAENFSVIHNMVPFNYMAYYLAEKLNIKETFVVGGKVTEVF